MYGMCREDKMCCGKPLNGYVDEARTIACTSIPRLIIDAQWPLLRGDK